MAGINRSDVLEVLAEVADMGEQATPGDHEASR